jgi:hypothetical protein
VALRVIGRHGSGPVVVGQRVGVGIQVVRRWVETTLAGVETLQWARRRAWSGRPRTTWGWDVDRIDADVVETVGDINFDKVDRNRSASNCLVGRMVALGRDARRQREQGGASRS